MTMGVYKITNVINNKNYVGSSKNIQSRWKKHKLLLNKGQHHSYKLQRDWTEFGENNFLFEILEDTDINNEKQLRECEQLWIDTLKSYKEGYNILPFADPNGNKSDIQKWNDENGGFVFFMFRYNKPIFDNLPQEYIFKLFLIATYLDYENNLTINKKDMMELIGLNRNSFGLFFNKLKDTNILLVEGKSLKINNSIFSKGALNKNIKQYNDFTRVYINPLKYLYNNYPIIKHSQIGSLLKLIPYTHRESNILCRNQIEELSGIDIMNKKDLESILNYHKNGIRNLLNCLKEVLLDNDEPVLQLINKNIVINPRVYYGGSFK